MSDLEFYDALLFGPAAAAEQQHKPTSSSWSRPFIRSSRKPPRPLLNQSKAKTRQPEPPTDRPRWRRILIETKYYNINKVMCEQKKREKGECGGEGWSEQYVREMGSFVGSIIKHTVDG